MTLKWKWHTDFHNSTGRYEQEMESLLLIGLSATGPIAINTKMYAYQCNNVLAVYISVWLQNVNMHLQLYFDFMKHEIILQLFTASQTQKSHTNIQTGRQWISHWIADMPDLIFQINEKKKTQKQAVWNQATENISWTKSVKMTTLITRVGVLYS